MQIIHSLNNTYEKPIALTIGNFDGIHIGHQKIIETLKNKAKALHLAPSIMSFSPHPKCFFTTCDHYLIDSSDDKIHYFKKNHLDLFLKIKFDQEFANLSPEQFIKKLTNYFHLKYLLIGDDFRFGKNGQGDYQFLCEAGKKYNFVVEKTETYTWNQKRISSSLIRQKLIEGDLDSVNTLLDRNYSFTGIVSKGQQMGRTIGFPTLNIEIDPKYITPKGVFAVNASIDSQIYPAVANLGYKPTVGGKTLTLETHLFDFNQSVYGKKVSIEFIKKIRDEIKFQNVEQLKTQIKKDCETAKTILKF